MGAELGVVTVFVAGVLSFVSPCVLPLLPVYLATLLNGRGGVPVNSLLFCSGFLLVFVGLGATASSLGGWLWQYQDTVRRIGALIVVAMGAVMLDIVPAGRLNREYRPLFDRQFTGPLGSFCAGAAFTLGWTPCNGPILAAVLGYAATAATAAAGAKLLAVYALGFILPFLAVAAFFGRLEKYLARSYRYLPLIRRLAGLILMAAGGLLFFNHLPGLAI
ncbi:MAG: cytochrome c biogenesis CcdA family protein [Negativicutes bacterium]|nr:cytochrome c biogenesis CcdA family protein [Negativicutes bacterium]